MRRRAMDARRDVLDPLSTGDQPQKRGRSWSGRILRDRRGDPTSVAAEDGRCSERASVLKKRPRLCGIKSPIVLRKPSKSRSSSSDGGVAGWATQACSNSSAWHAALGCKGKVFLDTELPLPKCDWQSVIVHCHRDAPDSLDPMPSHAGEIKHADNHTTT